MQRIMELMGNRFEFVTWSDRMILEDPIEAWPEVQALMSWYSDGFPLGKAI